MNLEYLASVVFRGADGTAYPDTLVGTDSHTTMINGLGVLGWGVGGIEAEAALLGQPQSMLIPDVVGFRLHGQLPEGATATDLVLTVTQILRKKGVVGKFVEFYGPGISALALTDRATIANMAPEYGATMGFFPVDAETLSYLRFTGRPADLVALVEAYCKAQGLFRTDETKDPVFSDTLELNLADVEPSLAGPRRPQDRVPLKHSKRIFRENLKIFLEGECANVDPKVIAEWIEEGGDGGMTAAAGRAPAAPATASVVAPPDGSPAAPQDAAPENAATPQSPSSLSKQQSLVLFPEPHRSRTPPATTTSPWRRRHRRDHVLHEHVEPVRHARRRPPRQEGRREGLDGQALGEDVARARLEGRHGLPEGRRAHAVPRRARLQPRRLRLHDVHRQLGPALRKPSPRPCVATSSRRPSSRATATSRGASTRRSR